MRFPDVNGNNLNDEHFNLPDDFEGDLTLVAVAFTQWQQMAVDSWLPAVETLQASIPGLTFYELPVVKPMSQNERNWLDNIMRNGIPDPLKRAITITIYTEIKPFLDALNLTTDKTTYMILLDGAGNVMWIGTGAYTPDKLAALETAIQRGASLPVR